ncbi:MULTISPECIES: hypothetical protein [unclassified Citrobacter]|uniref:hypothetical protein n=1 Tax=unclassified Citrobacter TaxID=2644389 RepID=UPI00227D5592|nr:MULTISPECIES: hypothetical protein [unclassified Citrobacter]
MTTNNHPAHGPVSLDRLHQISEILSKASAQSDGGNLGYAMADAVKVINGVIAAYGAEPVPFDALRDAVAEVSGGPVMEWSDIYKGHQAVPFINFNSLSRIVDKFRTFPPAPVVPEEITSASAPEIFEIAAEAERLGLRGSYASYAVGWNACRAAMLQDGNSPVAPDSYEDTKRLDWLDAQNKRLNEYYSTAYGWKFDANFQRNAMMLNDSNYPVMTIRQAIDEAIASAPKQENI